MIRAAADTSPMLQFSPFTSPSITPLAVIDPVADVVAAAAAATDAAAVNISC